MDVPTILILFLGAALAIYVVVMIEAVTRSPDEKPFSRFKKEKKKEPKKEQKKEKEKEWPPKEED